MRNKPFDIKLINDEKMINARPAADPPEKNICLWVDYDGDCKSADYCRIDI